MASGSSVAHLCVPVMRYEAAQQSAVGFTGSVCRRSLNAGSPSRYIDGRNSQSAEFSRNGCGESATR